MAAVSTLKDAQDFLADVGTTIGEIKETAEVGIGIMQSLGFDLGTIKVERTADGGWYVNGTIYPGTDQIFQNSKGESFPISSLPNWYPFGDLILQSSAWQKAGALEAKKRPAGWEMLDPYELANRLADWAQSGATEDQLARIAESDGSIGLPVSDPAQMDAGQLRAYWTGSLLVAALASGGNAPAYNAIKFDFEKLWRQAGNCRQSSGNAPETMSAATVENMRKYGICVGVPLNTEKESTAAFDQFGRLASPAPGDWASRARAIVRFLVTGETMQTPSDNAGTFAGFESCMRSGDPTCLASYQASSPDFWAALKEPWRFGYDPKKRLQVVNNTFGSFLAWRVGEKPRGISVSVAVAIGLPAVIALGTIAALTIYARGKTGGR